MSETEGYLICRGTVVYDILSPALITCDYMYLYDNHCKVVTVWVRYIQTSFSWVYVMKLPSVICHMTLSTTVTIKEKKRISTLTSENNYLCTFNLT